ncbi:MAG: hypothetical protein K2X03_28215 [Bryobacteraceae bacterium]|nr:hypothetical protein [Bryobacteraceae bacterium]
MKLAWGLVAVTLAAQECRLTPQSPAQPPLKVEEGERATESQTFQSAVFAVSPTNLVHFVDAIGRIRRMESNGRLTTLSGSSDPSLNPAVTQLLFSPSSVLHFVSLGRVWRWADGNAEAVAGSGLPGFNGESGKAAEVNLGAVANAAFAPTGELLIVDGYNRVRRLEKDGTLHTIAGGPRAAATAGLTGDNGPATAAALSSPRQVVPLRDGTLWIRDLTGRHLRAITPDGIIRTLQTSFDTNISILLAPDGRPMAVTTNRVYPLTSTGALETGQQPYPSFTGAPRGIGPTGSLYFEGNARPEQRNPLVRLERTQTVIAGAPVAATVDGQAPPFGAWRNGTLVYAAQQGGKSGILEARPGQAPRFVVGGGDDVGDADGKSATSLSIFGVQSFTVDGAGRIVLADVYRQRILVIETSGQVSVLRSNDGPIPFAPIGALATLQRITADQAGNIYWYVQGATPTGGVFSGDIAVWTRATRSVNVFTLSGVSALGRLDDGSAIAITGNSGTFRSTYRLTPAGLGEPVLGLRQLPLQSVTRWRDLPYFTAATRLFRGEPGRIQWLNLPNFVPDFVLATGDSLTVHLTDGGFYRLDGIEACPWTSQPVVTAVTNAASFGNPDTLSPRQLVTIFGTGLGPPAGQGLILDGLLRAGGQPAPFPAMVLGNFSGAIPFAALTGTTLPVVFSNDRQMTVQGLPAIPAGGESLLYFSWQGLTLIYPTPVRFVTATPGLFSAALNPNGSLNSAAEPAAAGIPLQLYATGLGAIDTNPALGDFFSLTALTNTVNAVTATVDGEPAEVLFAGGAPGQIGGLYQINLRLPDALAPGAHAVVLRVAGQNSNPLTVYVSTRP